MSAACFFFYGTLMDEDVFECVLGRRVPVGGRRPALLFGYRRVYVRGKCYPMLRPSPEGRVDGCVVDGLDAADIARIAAFEGEDYVLARREAEVGDGSVVEASLFLPRGDLEGEERAWELGEWRRRHKRDFLRSLRRGDRHSFVRRSGLREGGKERKRFE